MAVTRTPAPWRRPARLVEFASGPPDGDPRCYARNSPVMTAPPVTSAGKNILPRRPGAATGRASRRPNHQPSQGAGGGAAYRGDGAWPWPGSYLACRRHTSLLPGRAGPGRAGPDRSAARPADPDRPPGTGIAGPRQGVPQRVGHHLRHHDRDVLAAVCRTPPAQRGDGEVPRSTDRPGLSFERARGDPRRAGPACRAGSGGDRQSPITRPAISAASISQPQPVLPARCGRALSSPPGPCHRASRTGVCTFSDHQILAVLTGQGEVPPGGRRMPARTGPHFSTAPRECRCWLGVQPAGQRARPGQRRNRGPVQAPPGWPGDGR